MLSARHAVRASLRACVRPLSTSSAAAATSGATASAAASAAATDAASLNKCRPVRVIVLGGGVSGLTFAHSFVRAAVQESPSLTQNAPKAAAARAGATASGSDSSSEALSPAMAALAAEVGAGRDIHITVVEASDKLGGWIQSDTHSLPANPSLPRASTATSVSAGTGSSTSASSSALTVTTERGPRALSTHGGPSGSRGDAAQALALLLELGLERHVLEADDAAKHRFIYATDEGALREVTPLGVVAKYGWGAVGEPFRPPLKRIVDLTTDSSEKSDILSNNSNIDGSRGRSMALTEHGYADETICEFITRRFSRRIALELADPGVAGVHAGRIDRLSLRAAMPKLYFLERLNGSVAFPLPLLRQTPDDESTEALYRLPLRSRSGWLGAAAAEAAQGHPLAFSLPAPPLAGAPPTPAPSFSATRHHSSENKDGADEYDDDGDDEIDDYDLEAEIDYAFRVQVRTPPYFFGTRGASRAPLSAAPLPGSVAAVPFFAPFEIPPTTAVALVATADADSKTGNDDEMSTALAAIAAANAAGNAAARGGKPRSGGAGGATINKAGGAASAPAQTGPAPLAPVGDIDWYEGASPVLMQRLRHPSDLAKLRKWRKSGLVSLTPGMHAIPQSLAAALCAPTAGSLPRPAHASPVPAPRTRLAASFARTAPAVDPLWRLLAAATHGHANNTTRSTAAHSQTDATAPASAAPARSILPPSMHRPASSASSASFTAATAVVAAARAGSVTVDVCTDTTALAMTLRGAEDNSNSNSNNNGDIGGTSSAKEGITVTLAPSEKLGRPASGAAASLVVDSVDVECDYVVSTLPAHALAKLLSASATATATATASSDTTATTSATTAMSSAAAAFASVRHTTVWVVTALFTPQQLEAALALASASSVAPRSANLSLSSGSGVKSLYHSVSKTTETPVSGDAVALPQTSAANSVQPSSSAAPPLFLSRCSQADVAMVAAFGAALRARLPGFGALLPTAAVPAVSSSSSSNKAVDNRDNAELDSEGRSPSHPFYGLLGAVFDSDTFPSMTKGALVVTMMVGGDRFPEMGNVSSISSAASSSGPHVWTEERVRAKAAGYLHALFGFPVPVDAEPQQTHTGVPDSTANVAHQVLAPTIFSVRPAQQCIPQPAPGHTRAMQGATSALASAFGYRDLSCMSRAYTGSDNAPAAFSAAAAAEWSHGHWGAGPVPALSSQLPPSAPLSLNHVFIPTFDSTAASSSSVDAVDVDADADSDAGSRGLVVPQGAPLAPMAGNLLTSAGLVHPRLAVLGTAVTGPAVKDLIKEARFAAVRLARHIRAGEYVAELALNKSVDGKNGGTSSDSRVKSSGLVTGTAAAAAAPTVVTTRKGRNSVLG